MAWDISMTLTFFHRLEFSCPTVLSSAGFGLPKYLMGAGVGWLIGSKFHCGRLQKKLNSKHKADQKALYTQYYNDVYTLQQQNAELIQALEQMGVKMR